MIRRLGGLAVVLLLLAPGGAAAPTVAAAQQMAPTKPAPHAIVRPASGGAMCAALTVADLRAHGLEPADTAPSIDVEENGASAYCVYAGMSGAMGGIELDVFFPAGPDPKATETTADQELSGALTPAGLPGVDDSRIGLDVRSGGPPFSTITVRRRDLVFAISIPSGPRARERLLALSRLVLQRTGR